MLSEVLYYNGVPVDTLEKEDLLKVIHEMQRELKEYDQRVFGQKQMLLEAKAKIAALRNGHK